MRNIRIIAVVAVLLPFIACDKNDDQKEPKPIDANLSQLSYFQNSIVKVDSVNSFVSRGYGYPIDQTDTMVLSIGVDDLKEAKDIFNRWLAPDVIQEDNKGVISVKLLDELGVSAGVVVTFTPDETKTNIANVTFSPEKKMHHFSKIEFIKKESWPYNAESPYKIKDTETYTTFIDGAQTWVCIREAGTGVPGLLVYLSNSKSSIVTGLDWDFADPGDAAEASRILRSDWGMFSKCFADLGYSINQGGTGDWGDYYWTKRPGYWIYGYGICLKTGDTSWYDIRFGSYKLKNIQVRFFYQQY